MSFGIISDAVLQKEAYHFFHRFLNLWQFNNLTYWERSFSINVLTFFMTQIRTFFRIILNLQPFYHKCLFIFFNFLFQSNSRSIFLKIQIQCFNCAEIRQTFLSFLRLFFRSFLAFSSIEHLKNPFENLIKNTMLDMLNTIHKQTRMDRKAFLAIFNNDSV